MKTLLKDIVYSGIGLAGIYQRRRRKHRDKAIVLTYHGIVEAVPSDQPEYKYRNFVTCQQFENQIQFLLKHYRPLRVEDFFTEGANLHGGFLITFDDGFRNNYLYALPILKKYGLQGSFFITTRMIGSRELLWTEQVTRLLAKTRQKSVSLDPSANLRFSLKTATDREIASAKIRRAMKAQKAKARQESLNFLKEQLSDVDLSIRPKDEDRYLFMTWAEVNEMIRGGQSIGSHTHTHPILSSLSEDQSWSELEQSKKLIEEHTGIECLTMSYPNGEKTDYGQTQIRQLKQLGYQCAFTQMPFYNDIATDRYQLRRINISLKMTMPVFEAAISGVLR